MMKAHWSLILALSWLILTTGCTSENPNPEMLDPIYQDLVKQKQSYEKQIEDGKKTLELAERDLTSTEPRTLDRKVGNRAVEKAKAAIFAAEQKFEYLKVRTELRKAYVRKEYRIAYKEGKTWPNPKEYEAYKTNKTLVEADRSWSSRVPKTVHQELSVDSMQKAPEAE